MIFWKTFDPLAENINNIFAWINKNIFQMKNKVINHYCHWNIFLEKRDVSTEGLDCDGGHFDKRFVAGFKLPWAREKRKIFSLFVPRPIYLIDFITVNLKFPPRS